MDVRKLQYFLTVAEEGHVTRAAERLNIAQPPLSHQIKAFEAELGVRLVEKVGRQIRITKVGEALQERGQQILDLIERTEAELKALAEGSEGILAIGSVPSWGATALPERIRLFHRQFPSIRFRLREGNITKVTELLNNGIVELAILPCPFDRDRYEALVLPAEPFMAAMNEEMDDVPVNPAVSLLALAGKPLILHNRTQVKLVEYFGRHQVEPDVFCIQDDFRSMLALADAGLGVAVIPRSAAALFHGAHLVYKQISDPPMTIASAAVWLKNRQLSTAANNFLATFADS